ncbi:MAG: aminotransferase class IV [Candidatus Magasanikbacteria bacterium]|nr:aminotransferase class IV [Candidatus Magasanikbacteria bacterium]
MKVCVDGKFIDSKKAKISALDNGFLYGDAFYDTMRSYGGQILELELHLKRIEKSANTIGIKLPFSITKIEELTKKLVTINKIKDGRIRVTITRGVNGFDFLTCKKSALVITAENIEIDKSAYTKGVDAFTLNLQRPLPEIKMVGLTVMIQAYRTVYPKNGYEAILVDDNNTVREGASTNIFLVKNDKLITSKNKILNGLTRSRVIALAKSKKIKVVEKDFSKKDLYSADEIFLTNRPREIIPVIKIDGKKIKNGQVGPTTKKIMEEYQNYIKQYLKKSDQ